MKIWSIGTDHPAIYRFCGDYCRQWGLGDYTAEIAADKTWYLMTYDDRQVAVCGIRMVGRRLVIDAACGEKTHIGVIAVFAFGMLWKGMLECGDVDEVEETVLYRNKRAWKAIQRETKDRPELLIFRHRRKGP
jgi:hypothetical protein